MTLTREQALIKVARIIAERSTCSRGSVGCVIANEGRIIATGYNGAPSGMPHCEHECICGTEIALPRTWKAGCPRHDLRPPFRCTTAIHAECNAIAFAARHGIATQDADLYTTMAPCLSCAGLILNAGIRRVHLGDPYASTEGRELLERAAVKKRLEVVSFPD